MNIERHSIDHEDALDDFEYERGELDEYLGRLSDEGKRLEAVYDSARKVVSTASVVAANSRDLERAIAIVAGASAALFTLEAHEREGKRVPVEVAVGDLRKTLDHFVPQWTLYAGSWLTGFYCAVIARDQNALNALAAIPIQVIRNPAAQVDGYQYNWIAALQLHHQGGDFDDQIVDVQRAAAPEFIKIGPSELGRMTIALARALAAIKQGDADVFNRELEQALLAHRAIWGSSSNHTSDTGYIALGPLALACIAHDAGIAVQVVSGYMPMAAITRQYRD